jgi:hypothetical protein
LKLISTQRNQILLSFLIKNFVFRVGFGVGVVGRDGALAWGSSCGRPAPAHNIHLLVYLLNINAALTKVSLINLIEQGGPGRITSRDGSVDETPTKHTLKKSSKKSSR